MEAPETHSTGGCDVALNRNMRRGGRHEPQGLKFSENFQKKFNIFLACIRGGEGEGVLAQGPTHANKILDNF